MVLLDSLVVLVLVINTLLSVGILARSFRDKANRLFVLFVTFVDLWIVSNYLENAPELVGAGWLESFLRLDFASAAVALYFWLRFCAVFSGSKTRALFPRLFYSLALVLGWGLAVLSLWGDLILTRVSFPENIVHFEPGPFWVVYAAALVLFSLGGLVLLLRGRRNALRERKYLRVQQINLILLGFFFSVGNAIFINLFLQAFYPIGLEVSRIGLYGLTLLVALTAYAIAKHKLFDLKILVLRAASYLVFITVFAALYAVAVLWFLPWASGIRTQTAEFAVFLILTVVAALAFQPLERYISRLTKRIFFQNSYEPQNLLSALSRIMAETIELDILTRAVLKTLLEEMRIAKGAFLLTDGHRITGVESSGYPRSAEYKELEELFHRDPAPARFAWNELEDESLRKLFRELDIEVAIPIRVEKKEVALLILGPKNSGQAYFEEDLQTLQIFASEAGLAIENAKAFREIRKFNAELEGKVAERTKELKASQEKELLQAKEVARLKDEFVFLAAHELRTPINVIRGFLALAHGAKRLPKGLREDLDSISQASEQLNKLIADLLEVARSESGTLRVNVTENDLVPVLKSVVEELTPLAKEKNVRITVSTDERVPVVCDRDKLKEILMNLISNALKYNRPGGSVGVSSYREPGRGLALTEVRDTGYGIPERMQDKIFQKFFRAKAKGTEEVLGTGLGLFIVKMLLEKMNGSIGFSSKEGEGSIFTFTLPAPREALDRTPQTGAAIPA